MFVSVVIHFLLNVVVGNVVEECDKLVIIINAKNVATKKEMRKLNSKRIYSVDLVMVGGFGSNVKIY
jgi:hypothetical protein